MSAFTIILIVIVAFLAGMEGVLDQWQFHQPLVACTLIGLVSGQLEAGIILGGTLQMMALGWANVGAAVAPDAALASVASAILMVIAVGNGADQSTAISTAIAVAVPLSVAGLFLTMIVRTLAIPVVHIMDGAAAKGNFAAIDFWSIVAICMQGIRIAIPAAALCFIPSDAVMGALNMMPAWLSDGMSIGGGLLPAFASGLLILLVIIEIVNTFRKEKIDKAYFQKTIRDVNWKDMIPLGIGVLCLIGSWLIGLFLTLTVMLFCWLKVLSKYSWKKSAVVTVCVMAFLYGVFKLWLQLPLPHGLLGLV